MFGRRGLPPLAIPLVLASSGAPTVALASDAAVETPAPIATEEALLNPFHLQRPKRLVGIAEVGLGWLALPITEICGAGTCRVGDTTPVIDVWNLLRVDERFAVGAGLSLGLVPTTNLPPPSSQNITRSHQRSYLTLEATARYYPLVLPSMDLWVGAGIGLVVVSDTFDTVGNSDAYAPVGSPGITLRSEGLTGFGAIGLTHAIDEHWSIGGAFRAGAWRLPEVPEKSPLGDEASVTGLSAFGYLGFTVALHAEL